MGATMADSEKLRDRNRRVARGLVAIAGVVALGALLLGIRW